MDTFCSRSCKQFCTLRRSPACTGSPRGPRSLCHTLSCIDDRSPLQRKMVMVMVMVMVMGSSVTDSPADAEHHVDTFTISIILLQQFSTSRRQSDCGIISENNHHHQSHRHHLAAAFLEEGVKDS